MKATLNKPSSYSRRRRRRLIILLVRILLVLLAVLLIFKIVSKININKNTEVVAEGDNSVDVKIEGECENWLSKGSKKKDSVTPKEDNKNLILSNKDKPLGAEHYPEDLRDVNIEFVPYAEDKVKSLKDEAATMVETMFSAAKEDKIDLIGVSGFRSYQYQKFLYDNEVNVSGEEHAEKYIAKPGYSEHQTGLSIDIVSLEYSELDDNFEKTKAYTWLRSHASEYGFILRYPKEKEDVTKYGYEPWHYRYVGKSAAKKIAKENITLEEYLGGTKK